MYNGLYGVDEGMKKQSQSRVYLSSVSTTRFSTFDRFHFSIRANPTMQIILIAIAAWM